MDLAAMVFGWLGAVEFEQDRHAALAQAVADGDLPKADGHRAMEDCAARWHEYERRARVAQEASASVAA